MKKVLNLCILLCVLISPGCMVEEKPIEVPVEPTQVIDPAPTVEVIGPEDLTGSNAPSVMPPEDNNHYNGYKHEVTGKWVPGIPTYKSWFTPAPDVFSGSVFPYGNSVMEATAAYNGFSLDGYIDGVALMDCADQGLPVWLKRPGEPWEGPYLVVDCARRTDFYTVSVHNAEAVEVGFETAVRWGMTTPRIQFNGEWVNWWKQRRIDDVIVSKIPPQELEPDYEVVSYKEWFMDMVEFDPFESDEEATIYYRSVPTFLQMPPDELGGMPSFRIPPSKDFVQFESPYRIRQIYGVQEKKEVAAPKAMTVPTPTSVIKSFEVAADEFWIEVDLSQQIMYAHIGDQQVDEFVVSTGLPATPTPLGSFRMYDIYESYTMTGQKGPILGVKWSMFFHGDYAIHAADWHNNFGQPMSRGCINMRTEDAKWVYDRIEIGTHVYVHI